MKVLIKSKFEEKENLKKKGNLIHEVLLFVIIFIISPYKRNTIRTSLFQQFDRLIWLELVEDSQT